MKQSWSSLWLAAVSCVVLSSCSGNRQEYAYEPLPPPPASPPVAKPQPPAPAPGPQSDAITHIVTRAGQTEKVIQMPTPAVLPDSVIAWDAVNKMVTVPFGTEQAHFDFNLTNVSPETVSIRSAASSCYCTVAELPSQPWNLAPGASGQIHVTMDLRGKNGRLTKAITVSSDHGDKMLLANATVLAPIGITATPTVTAPGPMGDRERNQAAAKVDRQAVLRGQCAQCHVEPGRNKFGKDLYVSVCGVCHESERRATMVPNLHTIAQETNADFWRNWITNGKAGTLMPAFSIPHGGFLSEPQIASLVTFLTNTFPSHATPTSVAPN